MNEIDHLDVTPPPVYRLQFEREKAARALRGLPPPDCRICEILLSWFLDPPRVRIRRDPGEQAEASHVERRDSDSYRNYYWDVQPQVIHLGTFREAAASPCSQHTAMLKGVQLDFEDWVPGSGKLKFPHHGASLTYDQRGVRVTNLWTYAAAEWTIRRVKSLLLADNGDAEDRRGTVRVIDTVRALDK
jgi:hypothetical protein